jgi:Kef-type K+ transport system membrane component KefB/predicted amino acid-binding ACT domain protein
VNLLAVTDAVPTADIGTVLFHILVVLVAAKVAAELAERINVPAVLGEIVAGILIGPSVFGLVKTDEVLHVLGELGVILLLLNVGLEMDIAELSRVGRASLAVAVVGVAAPFIGGIAVGEALGHDMKTSVFLGAALTATSVGITARVFGDLGVLSTIESRIVLGAAVADDVLGLIILTVVVRVVVDGSVNIGTVLGITGLAVAFLVVTGFVGSKLAPPLFSAVHRFARSPSTLVAVAFAFTIGFSALASAAKLAPIIGAFMAGLAMNRSHHAERIARELTPIGHVFIPVFFLSIGISADVAAMARPKVLGLAAALIAVAIVGKLISAVGAIGTKSDKLTIGIGMIPRGEVGLIFATLGLTNGVLDNDLYAALIVVVLATTLMTPPLLKWKTQRSAAGIGGEATVATEPPPGGWLVDDGEIVTLRATPPADQVLPLALDAAARVVTARPSGELLDWFAATRTQPLAWDAATTAALLSLLSHGTSRTWRFLETLGVLERALPELSRALRARRADPAELDPTRVLRFPIVDRIGDLASDTTHDPAFAATAKLLERREPLLLAALVLDLTGEGDDAPAIARSVLGQLSISDHDEREAAALVSDALLLRAAALDPHSLDPLVVMQMAAHIGSGERLRAMYLLSVAAGDQPDHQRAVLDELADRVARELDVGGDANVCDSRREAAQKLTDDAAVIERLAHAPRSYILANDPDELVRQAALAEPPPRPGSARVAVSGDVETDLWRVDVACRDRPGLLARIASVFTSAGLDIQRASIATWGDGAVVDSFLVRSAGRPQARALSEALESSFRVPLTARPVTGASIRFDNDSLPWHTSCVVETDDRPGVLAGITTAFALAGVDVHSARIGSESGKAVDRFSLSSPDGRKLDNAAMGRIRRALEGEGGRAGRRALR